MWRHVELLRHDAHSAGRAPQTLLVRQLARLRQDGEAAAGPGLWRRALSDGAPRARR